MSNVISLHPAEEPNDEQRLNALGLSTSVIHTALTPGTSHARGRTELALNTTPGNDIYHDSMEEFALMLTPLGWQPIEVDRQPRLLHPDGTMSFTVASAKNVAHPDRRKKPRSRGKGIATRNSLAIQVVQELSLFELPESANHAALVAAARKAPFWMLLHERTTNGLFLELARPATMTPGGTVNSWSDSIAIPPLDLNGDLSIFDKPDSGDDFDFPVERL